MPIDIGTRVTHALDTQGIGGVGTIVAIGVDYNTGQPFAMVEWDVLKRDGHRMTRSAVYTIDLLLVSEG